MASPDLMQDVTRFPRFTFNPKEGIDNPALVISDDPEPEPGPVPRLCHLKCLEGQNFGFYLQVDQSSSALEVRVVEPWSPAELSGLREADRVLEVNEEFVDKMDIRRVVRKIRSCGLNLFMLVLNREDYQQAEETGVDLQALARSSKGEYWSRPRLCHVIRHPDLGLGMTVSMQGPKGRYVVTTVVDGPAEEAGVKTGDRLIWVNGVTASTLTHAALSRTMKKKGEDSVTVLVIDGDGEAAFARRRTAVLPVLAECRGLPYVAKTMALEKGDDGYGFLLREEKLASSRRTVHVLREVDVGSPAEAAGMEDGDLVLAVNGELVESMEHEDIVKRIRQSGDRVSLSSISMAGRHFYRELGISPLLFRERLIVRNDGQTDVSDVSKNRSGARVGGLMYPTVCVEEDGLDQQSGAGDFFL
ncbi:Na(+)/H(+) exchange regulatory cofactor NHE-RF3-like [Takifugu flavidus]|uniref:Na(+)/H(+) exchange regulatory cofactor NHE-RF3-like n=1 Tax=Takifugu flavidus TaxID=433684 RepID=UPI0025442E50|nr:Na(+)/H(+) exchange regulatory cofactor NHE-RF3-like [Takifugu flavidus]